MADTREFDVDQHLVWTGLGDGNLLVLDWGTSLLDDLSPLLRGELRCHC